METAAIDQPLLERTDPAMARPLAAALGSARADIVAAARDLLAIPEAALDQLWAWQGGSDVEIRYGAFRAAEALEVAASDARVAVAAVGRDGGAAARVIAPATAARWDLHGLLLPLADDVLDAGPGGGEWTVRLTLGHIISGQRAYGWGSAWWLAQGYAGDDLERPRTIEDAFWETLPDEATTEAAGDVTTLRDRLDTVLDLGTERLAGLPDEALALGSAWGRYHVPLGFRLGRWGSHIREHTIQVEKTLVMLGHVPSEPARLVRHVLARYGEAEATVVGRVSVDVAAATIAGAAAEARETLRSARAAAG
jgi:hypothetical protein